MNRRIERVNVTLRRELGALVRTTVADPRLAPITSITRVECSPDLGSARVYVGVMGDEEARRKSMEALRSAAGLLRHRLRDRVLMRHLPRLVFLPDRTMADAAEMLALMDRISEEDAELAERPEGQ